MQFGMDVSHLTCFRRHSVQARGASLSISSTGLRVRGAARGPGADFVLLDAMKVTSPFENPYQSQQFNYTQKSGRVILKCGSVLRRRNIGRLWRDGKKFTIVTERGLNYL